MAGVTRVIRINDCLKNEFYYNGIELILSKCSFLNLHATLVWSADLGSLGFCLECSCCFVTT